MSAFKEQRIEFYGYKSSFKEGITCIGDKLGPKTFRLYELGNKLRDSSLATIASGVAIGAEVRIEEAIDYLVFTDNLPLAVRSSALTEDAGNGIFETIFVNPSKNRKKTENLIQNAQALITDSLKNDSDSSAQETMSILIQPVVGDKYPEGYGPALSGVITKFQGKAILRFNLGLGTKVVSGREAISIKPDQVLDIRLVGELIQSSLQADLLVDFEENGMLISQEMPIGEELRLAAIESIPKLQALVAEWYVSTNGEEYWEFAISQKQDKPVVVQVHPLIEEQAPIEYFEEPEGRVVLESQDYVNYGVRRGNKIIVLGLGDGVSKSDLEYLKRLNKEESGFILVISDVLLSNLWKNEENSLTYEHFSHAAALIELRSSRLEIEYEDFEPIFSTIDHSGNRGGTHFVGICTSKNILFMSAEVDDLDKLFGKVTDRLTQGARLFEVDFKLQNTLSGSRLELMGTSSKADYFKNELICWGDEFYQMGSALRDAGYPEDRLLSDSFFNLTILVVADTKQGVLAHPFSWNGENGFSIEEMINSLELVLQNLWLLPQYDDYETLLRHQEAFSEYVIAPAKMKMQEYLEEYLSKLKSLLENPLSD